MLFTVDFVQLLVGRTCQLLMCVKSYNAVKNTKLKLLSWQFFPLSDTKCKYKKMYTKISGTNNFLLIIFYWILIFRPEHKIIGYVTSELEFLKMPNIITLWSISKLYSPVLKVIKISLLGTHSFVYVRVWCGVVWCGVCVCVCVCVFDTLSILLKEPQKMSVVLRQKETIKADIIVFSAIFRKCFEDNSLEKQDNSSINAFSMVLYGGVKGASFFKGNLLKLAWLNLFTGSFLKQKRLILISL